MENSIDKEGYYELCKLIPRIMNYNNYSGSIELLDRFVKILSYLSIDDDLTEEVNKLIVKISMLIGMLKSQGVTPYIARNFLELWLEEFENGPVSKWMKDRFGIVADMPKKTYGEG